MVEFIGNTQTVRPGGVIQFTDATVVGWTSAIHRDGSGVITLPANGCPCTNNGGYKVTFGANITFPATVPAGETAATAPISVAIAIGGEPDVTTEMIAVPAAAGDLVNVGRSTIVSTIGGCCANVSIENTSNGTIEVQAPTLIVEGV